jgi:3,4-dihydroxy 2-butanone 4-phosphate synthase/GTP cyclohydrolase II
MTWNGVVSGSVYRFFGYAGDLAHLPSPATIVHILEIRERTMIVQQHSEACLPTQYGTFKVTGFTDEKGLEHLCLIFGKLDPGGVTLVRIHSRCLTGDVFGSLRCDCNAQLVESLRRITGAGKGVVVYLDQEGRGIGLLNKIKAYEVQDKLGLDTVDANLTIGHPIDNRTYDVAVQILKKLDLSSIALLTNNPDKITALSQGGLDVQRIPLVVGISSDNEHYLSTKRDRLGHLIEFSDKKEKNCTNSPEHLQ